VLLRHGSRALLNSRVAMASTAAAALCSGFFALGAGLAIRSLNEAPSVKVSWQQLTWWSGAQWEPARDVAGEKWKTDRIAQLSDEHRRSAEQNLAMGAVRAKVRLEEAAAAERRGRARIAWARSAPVIRKSSPNLKAAAQAPATASAQECATIRGVHALLRQRFYLAMNIQPDSLRAQELRIAARGGEDSGWQPTKAPAGEVPDSREVNSQGLPPKKSPGRVRAVAAAERRREESEMPALRAAAAPATKTRGELSAVIAPAPVSIQSTASPARNQAMLAIPPTQSISAGIKDSAHPAAAMVAKAERFTQAQAERPTPVITGRTPAAIAPQAKIAASLWIPVSAKQSDHPPSVAAASATIHSASLVELSKRFEAVNIQRRNELATQPSAPGGTVDTSRGAPSWPSADLSPALDPALIATGESNRGTTTPPVIATGSAIPGLPEQSLVSERAAAVLSAPVTAGSQGSKQASMTANRSPEVASNQGTSTAPAKDAKDPSTPAITVASAGPDELTPKAEREDTVTVSSARALTGKPSAPAAVEAFEWRTPVIAAKSAPVTSERPSPEEGLQRGWNRATAPDHWATLTWSGDANPVPLVSQNSAKLLAVVAGTSLQTDAGLVFGKVPRGWTVELSARAEGPIFLDEKNAPISATETGSSRYFAFVNAAPGAHLLYLSEPGGRERAAVAIPIASGTGTYADLTRPTRVTVRGRVLAANSARPSGIHRATVRVVGQAQRAATTDRFGEFRINEVVAFGDHPIWLESLEASGHTHRYRIGADGRARDLYRFAPERVASWIEQLEGGLHTESGMVVGAVPGLLPKGAALNAGIAPLLPNSPLSPETYTLSSEDLLQVGQGMRAGAARFLSVQVPDGVNLLMLEDAAGKTVHSELLIASPGVINVVGPY
jgi:hypothetical protein